MVKLYNPNSGSADSNKWMFYYAQDVVDILLALKDTRLILDVKANTLLTPDKFLLIKEDDIIKVLPLVGGG